MMSEPMIYLDTELRPNASLSRRGFILVIVMTGLVSAVASLAYWRAGAWPVLGAFGLDMAIIWGALWFSRRAQSQVTYVRVDANHVRLWHMQAGRPDKRLDLPTAFVRVSLDTPVTDRSFISLRFGARAWVIGRFLTPTAREKAADQICRAIQDARLGAGCT